MIKGDRKIPKAKSGVCKGLLEKRRRRMQRESPTVSALQINTMGLIIFLERERERERERESARHVH